MPDDHIIIIEIVSEGVVDLGRGSKALPGGGKTEPGRPDAGIVPLLVHALCDRPNAMQVVNRPLQFLQRGSLSRKVAFAKTQACYNRSAGLVFVVDTEGNHPRQLQELRGGRDSKLPDFPTAVGVAHPCIEAWLLADPVAIKKALKLSHTPEAPQQPESLPAPCKDHQQNPKMRLGQCAGRGQPLSSEETTRIAREIYDLKRLRDGCPESFAPFAEEVEARIKPLFDINEGVHKVS